MKDYDGSLSAHLKMRFASLLEKIEQMIPIWESATDIDPHAVLNEREMEIFFLLGMSRTPREIAIRLFISVQSVESHIKRISRKLRVRLRDLPSLAAGHVSSPSMSMGCDGKDISVSKSRIPDS